MRMEKISCKSKQKRKKEQIDFRLIDFLINFINVYGLFDKIYFRFKSIIKFLKIVIIKLRIRNKIYFKITSVIKLSPAYRSFSSTTKLNAFKIATEALSKPVIGSGGVEKIKPTLTGAL